MEAAKVKTKNRPDTSGLPPVNQAYDRVSHTETYLIDLISRRAAKLARKLGKPKTPEWSVMQFDMDLTLCHVFCCRLDLVKLLAAKDGDFGHDVMGIRSHLDRRKAELKDGFSPRLAARENSE